MSYNLTNSIFKITGSEKGKFGTGFIVHKDSKHSYFLTCHHVISDVGGEKNLNINGEPAEIYNYDKSSDFDIAILIIKKILPQPSLKLKESSRSLKEQTLSGHGFRNVGEQIAIEGFECQITKEIQITSEQGGKREKAWWVKTKETDVLHHGFSGSPIFDTKGSVIGFVNQKKGKGDEGLVISINTILHIWENAPLIKTSAIDNRIQKEDSSLINFKDEIEALKNILENGDEDLRLLAIEGRSGMGKTRLIREYLNLIDASTYEMKIIDLKKPMNVEDLFDRLTTNLGEEYFADYIDFLMTRKPVELTREKEKQWHKNLNRKFFSDLYKISKGTKYFLIFDHFEKADRDFKDWISTQFLERNTAVSNIIVIIGGQEVPSISYEEKHCKYFEIKSIAFHNYKEYVEINNIPIEEAELKLIHEVCNGSPSQLVPFIEKYKIG